MSWVRPKPGDSSLPPVRRGDQRGVSRRASEAETSRQRTSPLIRMAIPLGPVVDSVRAAHEVSGSVRSRPESRRRAARGRVSDRCTSLLTQPLTSCAARIRAPGEGPWKCHSPLIPSFEQERRPERRLPRLVLLLALLVTLAAQAQTGTVADVYLGAEIRPDDCRVGETVRYRVYATVQNNVTAQLEPSPPPFPQFDVVGDPETRQTDKEQETIFEWTFKLRPRQAGRLTIAPFAVTYQGLADGQTRHVESDQVQLRVRSQQETRDIRPAKGLVEVPDFGEPYRLALLLLGLVVGLALLAGGLGWILTKVGQRPVAIPPPPPPTPPELVALQRLNELAAKKLLDQGELDAYHIELSEIARAYLHDRYDLPATASTTSEIALGLYDRQVASEVVILVRGLLYGCDLEKFAAHRPTREESEQLLTDARELVDRTRQSVPQET